MELACALVLLIIGSATAGPYGYGTKGGAAAKADARAVAGAYAGSGSIPLSIPSGASYSGSFSQSSSSSSSSSSASSNSFSYSGSGAVGGVLPGGKGCGSGNCNAGGAIGAQGSAAAGSQAYSGANAGSLAGGYGGKIPTGTYDHDYSNEEQDSKNQDCASGSCQGTSDLNSSSGSGAGIGSLSGSNAKATASAGAGHTGGSDCGGSDCNNIPGADNKCDSGKCGSKAKCSSGDCGAVPYIGGTPSHHDNLNKCSSGQCGSNQDTDESSTIDSETNDINVHSSGSAKAKSSYGANKPSCSNGNCDSSPGSPITFGYNKPALDLTAPKLEPPCSGANCRISTSYQNQLGHVPSPGYGSLSKPNYGHGSLPSSAPFKPSGGVSCAPGTPGCGITAPLSNPSAPGYNGPSDEPNYSYDGTPSVNPSSPACAPGTPGCKSSSLPNGPSGCAFGFCDTHPSVPSITPSNAYGSSPPFSSGNPVSPACAPGKPGCSTAPSTNRPDCASGNCGTNIFGYGTSFGIKPSSPSYSSLYPSGPACTPGSPGCTISTSPSGPSGCASGNCGGSPTPTGYTDFEHKPSYSHGSSPSHSFVNPSDPACTPGSPGCPASASHSGPSGCALGGNCGGSPISTGYTDFGHKPSYSLSSLPSHSSVNPSGPACTPGSPGCPSSISPSGPSGCASGNCGGSPSSTGYTDFGHKPSYSHGSSSSHSSVNPSGPACTPGSPGCPTSTSPSGPLGCAPGGNCGGSPISTGYTDFGYKPTYSHGTAPSHSVYPSGLACTPGSPGCPSATSPSGPSDCASGNCGGSPTSTGYNDFSNKPSYSHGSSPAYFPSKPTETGCAPGSLGCGLTPTATGSSGCAFGKCSVNQPSYSNGNSPSYTPEKPLGFPCAPGTPGCSTTSPASYPKAPGYAGSSILKPSYSQGFPSYSTLIPSGPACAPGTPGCSSASPASYPSAPGYGGSSTLKPNYSQGLPSFSPLIPSGPACAPGSPGCALSPSASNPSGCASGNCGTYPASLGGPSGIKPSYPTGSLSIQTQLTPSGSACAPGTPGCALTLAPSGSSGCTSGNCDEFPPIGGQANFPSIKPDYSQGSSSYFSVPKPSGPGCTPGAPGCAITSSLSSPSGCASGNCGANQFPQGCAPGTPGCSGSASSLHLGATGHSTAGASAPGSQGPSYGSSSLPSGQTGTGISAPGYGASGVGSSLHQAAYGSHGTGSLQTFFTKPSTGFPAGPSGSGAYTPGFPTIPFASSSAPGLGSSSQLGVVGASAGADGQHDKSKDLPPYTGGFGGPAGILKPNEYNAAPPPSYGNKPAVPTTTTTTTTTVKPSCVSGNCNSQALPSLVHGGSASGGHATAAASASADAVVYTGGFGGPPGLLKPYDNSKGDIKGTTGLATSLNIHHGVDGSGGSQVGGSAVARANAAAVSSVGASSGDDKHNGNHGGYSHGHDHDDAGGCGGGCGGSGDSGSDGLGYSGSLGLSKTGVLNGDSGNGLAVAGAAAKSVANTSSGARAFGGSYASSSATAHAGASVKGGYGRR